MTRIEQVYDTLAGRTSTIIGPKEIIDPKHAKRMRGQSMMSTISPSPIITEFNEFTTVSPKRRNISGIPSPKMLPDIVGPRQIIPTLHQKTHFKAATSVFLNHQGTLSHKDNSDETGRHVEKILNDINVKHNL